MKHKLFPTVVLGCMLLSVMAMAGEVNVLDSCSDKLKSVFPEGGEVDDLDQITLTLTDTNKFGAFVYMPSLYFVEKDGSIGEEVSACQLMDVSARGKDTLRFKVLNPPARSGKYALLIKNNSFSIISGCQGDSAVRTFAGGESGLCRTMKKSEYGSRFSNFHVDLKSDTLRILHISNSYGGNLLEYVDALMKSAGVDVSQVLVERLVYSGGSFKNWYEVYMDVNTQNYWYFKMAGDLKTNLEGWEGDKNDGSKFRSMLADNPWDLIIINQASAHAPYYENWESGRGDGYLPQLLDIIRSYQPEVPVGMLLIHSYAECYEGNTEHWTTTERWEKLRDGVEWLRDAYGIDFVVPYGTAIQNLRLTEYNNSYDLTGDGVHLSGGLAKYAAGCCYFETVFGPRYDKTVWGNPLRLPYPDEESTDKFYGCIIPVDDASAETAQKAAFLASRNMYEVRNPNLADLTEYEYGEELNQDEYCILYDFNSLNGLEGLSCESSYSVYGPSGILIGKTMSEDEWMRLPEGLYIRNGEKIYKKN